MRNATTMDLALILVDHRAGRRLEGLAGTTLPDLCPNPTPIENISISLGKNRF